FAPNMAPSKSGFRWGIALMTIVVLAGLLLAWRFTPLAQLATPDNIIGWAHDFAGRWWAPLLVILAYTPACFVMFPRPLITLFAIVAFGTKIGVVYAVIGVMLSAEMTYLAGRLFDRGTVRRVAGEKLNRVSEVLRRRGLLAVTALRLVPAGPFAVVGLVAGAIRIKLWHYTVGTAIGLVPGTLATLMIGDQLEAGIQDPSTINYWPVVGAVVVLAAAAFAGRRWFLNNKTVHAQ
ncbi:MAG TPA: VTT domain-containing protein, partial [Burkholderiales bacterium]|nr:VTT domain-containing protein [Burkholderiales bacterium]